MTFVFIFIYFVLYNMLIPAKVDALLAYRKYKNANSEPVKANNAQPYMIKLLLIMILIIIPINLQSYSYIFADKYGIKNGTIYGERKIYNWDDVNGLAIGKDNDGKKYWRLLLDDGKEYKIGYISNQDILNRIVKFKPDIKYNKT